MSRLSDIRLYVVTATDTGAERLLRAANKSRAVRLAATARIATQADLERLFAKGVVPEGPHTPRPPSKPRAQRQRA